MSMSSIFMRGFPQLCLVAFAIGAMAGDALDIPAVPVDGAGRLECFAEKVRSGTPVTIGYIGGSITQGTGSSSHSNCYYWRSSQELLKAVKAHGGTGSAVLAAVGGTGSEYGAYRIGPQLLDKGVDLLVVEFAVNDGDSEKATDGMEGIVRHAWRVNPKTAIVFLYTTTASAVKDFYMEGKAMPSVLLHHKVAAHYGIAEVHCGPKVADGIAQGRYNSKEFFPDGCHPSDIGHGVYAELLCAALLPSLDWKPSGKPLPPLPAPLGEGGLGNADWIKLDSSRKSGEWTECKPGYYTPVGGWAATSTASMTIPVKGSRIGLVLCKSNAKIKISGLGFERSYTGIAQNPPWVPATIWVYEGPAPVEGAISVEVEPAASGDTKADLEGILVVRGE